MERQPGDRQAYCYPTAIPRVTLWSRRAIKHRIDCGPPFEPADLRRIDAISRKGSSRYLSRIHRHAVPLRDAQLPPPSCVWSSKQAIFCASAAPMAAAAAIGTMTRASPSTSGNGGGGDSNGRRSRERDGSYCTAVLIEDEYNRQTRRLVVNGLRYECVCW